ncbi:MAG: hypothetical protein JKY30_11740 [Flavobacteriales bacterium]|nr:hypothetical protein [Flavobacteriales bacterium]
MVRFVIFLVSVFSFGVVASQNYIEYHNLCNEGCQLMLDGKYVEAKEKILDAIDLVDEPLSADYFNLAKCYSRLDAPETTQYYLELSLHLTNRGTKKYIEHGLWFEPVFGKEKWNKILNADYLNKELSEFQIELNRKIDTLLKIKQKYFNLYYDSIVVYHPYDSLLLRLYRDSVDVNSEIVSVELERIINEYGWPGVKLNGWTELDYNFVDDRGAEWFYKMEKKLIEEIDKGNLYPWVFIDMADRAQGESKLPCKYNGGFCNVKITPEIRANCKKIGAPLGEARKRRRLN